MHAPGRTPKMVESDVSVGKSSMAAGRIGETSVHSPEASAAAGQTDLVGDMHPSKAETQREPEVVDAESSQTNLAGIGYGTAVGVALSGVASIALGAPAILSATAVGAIVGGLAGGAVEHETDRGVVLDPVVEFDSVASSATKVDDSGADLPPTETYDFRGEGHGKVHAGSMHANV